MATINGTIGNNILNGTSSEDVINGLAGLDTLNGLEGNDTLNGGDGNDYLDGGSAADRFTGGDGNNILVGGVGDARLTGGAEADKFEYLSAGPFTRAAFGVDTITDFVNDFVRITLGKNTFGINDLAVVGVVANDALAATSDKRVTYSSGTGRVFFNQKASVLTEAISSRFRVHLF